MFTQPVASPPTVGPVPTSVTNPASPSTRSSRLRGLSYLRSYTQNHILSREHSSQGSNSPTSNSHSHVAAHSHFHHNTGTSPHSQTQTQTQNQNHHSSRSGSSRPTPGLQRSLSYSPTSTPRRSDTDAHLNPLSLVASLQESPSSSTSSANRASTTPSSPAVERPPVDALPSILDDVIASGSTSSHIRQQSDQQPQSTNDAEAANMTRARASTTGDAPVAATPAPENLPSIRFSAYYDPRATRPSLTFPPVSRTLPSNGDIIRVGRYSERDNQPSIPNNTPSAAPVGFKSKVVSRRHCEFWYDEGKWYIKDVKSSSGTFLNHIRLSPPGTESKPFPVNDGDIVQLGIDFKGGEEMIFRCVKMRLELNRGWQNKLNTFNMATHKRLRNMTAANSANSSTQDCSICLNSIAPCQCLFVAPCSHTWHFKCIRSLLNSPQYPIFVCPNCRMAADLEADIEDPEEDWEQMEEDEEPEQKQQKQEEKETPATVPTAPLAAPAAVVSSRPQLPEIGTDDDAMDDFTVALDRARTVAEAPEAAPRTVAPHTSIPPVPIPAVGIAQTTAPRSGRDTRTPSPIGNHLVNATEGPITPRNDAGPWVFDGSAGRRAAEASSGMRSLDAAAEMEVDR
ncbi:FHA domain-containing protein [Colletotrichum paranaense]|uniref:RING-type E3 ubiquitin transferase n=3 Tax=Colletotrichum acutatum species complex TaxID=2707335 RepID=A0AAI9V1T5_9PEZI|nr:FHA domain-containing protein [Colletotrichum paranaense]KAK0373913.1 FHA domain-containing protein [Colletotrichum limetticola]KAK1466099.1 FHA domain-containing protein [Colletotrichum cuscutae]KAK1517460.1 FHA domain-containing protein [Colletotrichum paranaense]